MSNFEASMVVESVDDIPVIKVTIKRQSYVMLAVRQGPGATALMTRLSCNYKVSSILGFSFNHDESINQEIPVLLERAGLFL